MKYPVLVFSTDQGKGSVAVRADHIHHIGIAQYGSVYLTYTHPGGYDGMTIDEGFEAALLKWKTALALMEQEQ